MMTSSKSNFQLPVWNSGKQIDPQWIHKVSGIKCQSCSATDISNETRKSAGEAKDGATLRLTLERQNEEKETTLIVKQSTQNTLALAQQLGLAREALFYSQLARELAQESLPHVYYSYGNFETGQKFILMEDLQDAIDSGCLFGNGNPNNWNRDLKTISAKVGDPAPSSKQVALVTFKEMAKIHAVFWRSKGLLSSDKIWLRGQEWLQGEKRESWEASQQLIQGMWKAYLDSGKAVISWDSRVRAAVEKAMNGISWDSQLARLHPAGHWTLVHGDFWPGNVMWMTKASNEIKLIDWEMVGLGSGPQELGQYVISNMDSIERKQCENELVKSYYDELKKNLSDDECCTWDYCWEEYKVGGVERWLWFLVYFVGNGMGDWAQFFHDQVAAFMRDHGMTASCITQPRP